MKKTNFFIVGAPKCGTTAMHHYLSQHPDVFMCHKEPHYFCSDIRNDRNIHNYDEYIALFENAGDSKYLGDASVWYLFSKVAAEEIYQYNPDAKILIMLRNPVDMLYSLHSQMIFNQDEDILDFEEALAAEPDRTQGKRIPPRTKRLEGILYSQTARYAGQVKRYLDVFPKENVHIIIFDDFKNDISKCFNNLCDFLGIDQYLDINFETINSNKSIKNQWLLNIFRYSPNFIRKLATMRIPFASMRDRMIKCIYNSTFSYTKRDPMNPQLRVELQHRFSCEIDTLSDLIERDLSSWYK